ncbi:hypothetical protein AAC387_Pa12g0526 [Persea americana]
MSGKALPNGRNNFTIFLLLTSSTRGRHIREEPTLAAPPLTVFLLVRHLKGVFQQFGEWRNDFGEHHILRYRAFYLEEETM